MTTVVDGTAGITFPDLSIQSSSGYTGFRNRLINGDMRIDSRNAGAQITPASGQYLLDRWVAYSTQSGYFTVQQNAGGFTPPAGYSNYIGMTSTGNYSVGGTDAFYIAQRIEGNLITDLAWNSSSPRAITVSFYAYSNATGSFGGAIYTDGGRSYVFTYAITISNIWQYFTVVIPGDTIAVGTGTSTALTLIFSLGAGAGYSGIPGIWSANTWYQPANSASILGTSGTYLNLTAVQLEVSSVTSPSFERRHYAIENILCQRYYNSVTGIKTPSLFATGTNSLRLGSIFFPVTMRATPNITFSSITYSNSSGLATDVLQPGFFTTTANSTAQGIVDITFSYAADAELT